MDMNELLYQLVTEKVDSLFVEDEINEESYDILIEAADDLFGEGAISTAIDDVKAWDKRVSNKIVDNLDVSKKKAALKISEMKRTLREYLGEAQKKAREYKKAGDKALADLYENIIQKGEELEDMIDDARTRKSTDSDVTKKIKTGIDDIEKKLNHVDKVATRKVEKAKRAIL